RNVAIGEVRLREPRERGVLRGVFDVQAKITAAPVQIQRARLEDAASSTIELREVHEVSGQLDEIAPHADRPLDGRRLEVFVFEGGVLVDEVEDGGLEPVAGDLFQPLETELLCGAGRLLRAPR